jgi:hypothetical protein
MLKLEVFPREPGMSFLEKLSETESEYEYDEESLMSMTDKTDMCRSEVISLASFREAAEASIGERTPASEQILGASFLDVGSDLGVM